MYVIIERLFLHVVWTKSLEGRGISGLSTGGILKCWRGIAGIAGTDAPILL
jgi:hypothetical protein